MPHVLHIVPALFGPAGLLGGAERYAFELARHMADETPTELVSFGERPCCFHEGKLRVRVLGPAWRVRGQRTNPLHLGLLRAVARADVVHCHQQHVLASSLAALACRLSGRRVFVSDLGGGGWDISGYVSTERWYQGHLHISEYSRNVAGQQEMAGTHVIYGGVDAGKFTPPADAGGSPGAPVVFVGRLLPHKGINYLIEALPEDMELEVVGQPYDRRYWHALQALAAGKRVRFRSDCDDAELVRAYQRARCIVLPSVYRTIYGDESWVPELLGQTLLEGMACGLPALATAVASLPEVVADGATGWVVPPNDAAALRQRLIWFRDHPAEAAAMGAAGRQRVLERFTWEQVVRRCLEIYRAAG